jgi:anhydro-N-acetylmuramic acid kinase
MTFPYNLKKKNLIAIGLNSGTSADGLDLAAIRINYSSLPSKVSFIAGVTVPYPKKLRHKIDMAINDRFGSIDELVYLDRELGIFYGEQAAKFCGRLRRKKIKPDLIGSHGQTVRHLPGRIMTRGKKESGTLQLGHPESIAERTGLVTVADFRQADIAAGGEGAPITCQAMWQLFSHRRESRLLINIGGMANYFLFPAGTGPERLKASDCGPGNSLLDLLAQKYLRRRFDEDGRAAVRGKISQRLLTLLLADKYLRGMYGHSTGKERFGEKFVAKIINYASRLKLKPEDILATAVELTAVAIASSVRDFLSQYDLSELYLFGGGLKNRYLVARIAENLPGIVILPVDKLGYNPDYLEAIAYALMGGMAIRSMASGLKQVTGARAGTIAGRIIQPSWMMG